MGLPVDRWKGENVATNEVCDILTLLGCIAEANVYGVKVPGNVLFYSLSQV